MTRHGAAAVLAAALLCSAAANAHDLWIEPTTWTPRAGEWVGARLWVGEHLRGERIALGALPANRFVLDDRGGRRTLAVQRGADVGMTRVEAGAALISYRGDPVRIDLPADRFNAYLAEEGLDAVIDQRARRGQTGELGREEFRRCAKSLLNGDAAADSEGDRALGLALELVAERNPYALAPGEELPVRLTFEGRPLAGALVVALSSTDAAKRQAARSDAEGRVRLRIEPADLWLVKAVHMVDAGPASQADWSSYWASLTFGWKASNSP